MGLFFLCHGRTMPIFCASPSRNYEQKLAEKPQPGRASVIFPRCSLNQSASRAFVP
jgi:hypothetical protein